jgi:hypothetical protein
MQFFLNNFYLFWTSVDISYLNDSDNVVSIKNKRVKYNKALDEVELLMNEMLGKLNIALNETNLYPTDDMFRIIVREIDVENLKILSFIYNEGSQEVIDDMTPVIKEFMYWWGDNLDYGTINIQSLIAKKEEKVISSIILENSDKGKNIKEFNG